MTDISKNIKKLRGERGLTRAQLAARLGEPAQKIADWEEGRAQPDFAALARLAAALETAPETLVYGKTGVAPDPARARRRAMTAALSVVGSLFVAAGLILILVRFWQDLGGLFRAALSFLPLLVGGGWGLFVTFSKKDGVSLRESGAVLWIAGVLATNALINGIFRLDLGFNRLLLADLLLTLPVMFLLRSVFAYTATLVMGTVLALDGDLSDPSLPLAGRLGIAALLVCVVLLCGVFVRRVRLPQGTDRYAAAVALAAAGAQGIAVTASLLDGTDATTLLQFMTLFYCLWLAGSVRGAGLPLRGAGGAGFGVTLFCFTLIAHAGDRTSVFRFADVPAFLVPCALCVVLCALYGRQSLRGDKTRVAGAIVMAALFPLSFCLMRTGGAAVLLPSLIYGVWTLVSGILRARLSAVNFGLVNVLALLGLILSQTENFDLLPVGGLALFSGAVLLVVNKVLVKKFAAEKTAAPGAEPGTEEDPGGDAGTGTEVTEDA